METLDGLAEKYARRDDLYTENGEYTKTTIINAFNDGAKAMLQVIGFSLAAHRHKETKVTTKKEMEWLVEQINKTNMEVKELRIGDWVKCKTIDGENFGKICDILDVGYFAARCNGVEYRGKVHNVEGVVDCIKPIRITDEMLLKSGFEQCGYIFKTLFVEMYEVENGWHLHIDNERFETALSITIKYVHQLQNAYYIATGKELEIKL